jgi:hypothetical protein
LLLGFSVVARGIKMVPITLASITKIMEAPPNGYPLLAPKASQIGAARTQKMPN